MLRLFVYVCETRNIARAAGQANLVGSAISKAIAQLEDTVGVKLLQRRKHGVESPAARQTPLEHAREMLATSQRVERVERIERAMGGYAIGSYTTGVRGEVRVLDYEQVSMAVSSAVHVMRGRAAAARFAASLAAALRMQHILKFTRL